MMVKRNDSLLIIANIVLSTSINLIFHICSKMPVIFLVDCLLPRMKKVK